jgi:N-acetylmuramoyl-L-alanine amidase
VRAKAAGVAAAACWLSIVLLAQQPSSASYTVISRQARQPLPVRVFGGQEMFALDDLARLFNLAVREDTTAGALTVTSGAQTIVLSPQQPLASVAGRMISLPAAPVRDGRAWFVPVDFVSRALAPGSATRIELRKPSRLVLTGDIRMPRVAARVEGLGSLTRVTIDVAPPTPHAVTQDGTRLIVRFDADALDAGDLRVPAPTDTLQAIRAGDTPQTIVLELGPRFASFRAADQAVPAGGTRIVIDLQSQTEAAAPGTQPQQPAPPGVPAPGEAPPLLDLPAPGGLRTIVIDPGHGGQDDGSRGAQGTLEKNVALSVARRLKGSIEARLGVRVLLTRDGDAGVAPDQRAAVANNNKAELFISLHANAAARPGTAGAEVFYLNLEGYGDQAQRATQGSPEALPVAGGGSRTIEITPWEMAQAHHVAESTTFARAVEGALRERGIPMNARALQQAPLRVLVGANMPAILVEMGFLTNAQDEQRLAGDAPQNVLVQALLEGIVRFRAASAGTR